MSYHELSDTALLERLKNSDTEAFNALFHGHWKWLYKAACDKTGDAQAAFDLVQDIFVQLWLQRASLEIRESLEQYLSGALRNQVFNYYRASRRKKEQLRVLGNMLAAATESADDDQKERARRETDLERAVDSLPRRIKDVYLLRIQHEYSFRDIADRLNIKPQTAKNAFSRALVLLRENLSQELLLLLILLSIGRNR